MVLAVLVSLSHVSLIPVSLPLTLWFVSLCICVSVSCLFGSYDTTLNSMVRFTLCLCICLMSLCFLCHYPYMTLWFYLYLCLCFMSLWFLCHYPWLYGSFFSVFLSLSPVSLLPVPLPIYGSMVLSVFVSLFHVSLVPVPLSLALWFVFLCISVSCLSGSCATTLDSMVRFTLCLCICFMSLWFLCHYPWLYGSILSVFVSLYSVSLVPVFR
jgi:hypothetical protein